MGRRRSGTVRKLSSGRWQDRHLTPAGKRVTAPGTFATKTDALRWVAAAETDLGRGEGLDPRAGTVAFTDWARYGLSRRARSGHGPASAAGPGSARNAVTRWFGGDDGNRAHDPLLAKQSRQTTSVLVRARTPSSRRTSGHARDRCIPARTSALA